MAARAPPPPPPTGGLCGHVRARRATRLLPSLFQRGAAGAAAGGQGLHRRGAPGVALGAARRGARLPAAGTRAGRSDDDDDDAGGGWMWSCAFLLDEVRSISSRFWPACLPACLPARPFRLKSRFCLVNYSGDAAPARALPTASRPGTTIPPPPPPRPLLCLRPRPRLAAPPLPVRTSPKREASALPCRPAGLPRLLVHTSRLPSNTHIHTQVPIRRGPRRRLGGRAHRWPRRLGLGPPLAADAGGRGLAAGRGGVGDAGRRAAGRLRRRVGAPGFRSGRWRRWCQQRQWWWWERAAAERAPEAGVGFRALKNQIKVK